MRILLAAMNAQKGDAGRALLVRYADHRIDGTWWGPPGGGLAPGEDHLAAVRRELREELARDELRSAGTVVTPRDLPHLLDRVARGELPDPDQDLGT